MSKYHDLSLLTRVAINLAKKDITVRLRQPCIKNIGGLAMARPGGCTIDLHMPRTRRRQPALTIG
jgi:hypothetical protein